ncbi:MAG: hypothetical protein AB1331_08500 [Bacillota bacterium]
MSRRAAAEAFVENGRGRLVSGFKLRLNNELGLVERKVWRFSLY